MQPGRPALTALLWLLMIAATAAAPIEFTLADQDGQPRVVDYPRAKVSVFVVADQKGSAEIAGWIEPTFARYQNSVEISGIAALPGIPPMFQGLFRREFKKRLSYPVMLDWDGDVSRRLGYRKAGAQLLVVSRSGEITLTRTGPATSDSLGAVYAAIDALLSRR